MSSLIQNSYGKFWSIPWATFSIQEPTRKQWLFMVFVTWMTSLGGPKVVVQEEWRNTKRIKFISSPHGTCSFIYRLFYNAILLFIFIYIDILALENGGHLAGGSGGYVLLVIGIYGTVYLVIKCIFALYYHFKWLITEKCCLTLEKG